VGPLPSAKDKRHIDNALDAKITTGLVHNGERGFHIHVLLLYSCSISQSYRGFTYFWYFWLTIQNTAISQVRNLFSVTVVLISFPLARAAAAVAAADFCCCFGNYCCAPRPHPAPPFLGEGSTQKIK
jgi:hypothetical protein